ncbi:MULTISPECIES: hypothetical protein [unclassified Kribbella]|uniref:hypothetical protein n=1 Tax=unclassified Kribbella TaxID=2644121 RepID=UPI0030779D0E
MGFSISESSDPMSIQYLSKETQFVYKQPGQVIPEARSIPQASAGAVVSFASSGAVLFAAQDCVTREIENAADVGTRYLELIREGLLPRDSVLVGETIHARKALILVSGEREARTEFVIEDSASAMPPSIESVVLHGQLVSHPRMAIHILAQSVVPLFRAFRPRRRYKEQGEDRRPVVVAEGDHGDAEVDSGVVVGVELEEVVPGVGIPDE